MIICVMEMLRNLIIMVLLFVRFRYVFLGKSEIIWMLCYIKCIVLCVKKVGGYYDLLYMNVLESWCGNYLE